MACGALGAVLLTVWECVPNLPHTALMARPTHTHTDNEGWGDQERSGYYALLPRGIHLCIAPPWSSLHVYMCGFFQNGEIWIEAGATPPLPRGIQLGLALPWSSLCIVYVDKESMYVWVVSRMCSMCGFCQGRLPGTARRFWWAQA